MLVIMGSRLFMKLSSLYVGFRASFGLECEDRRKQESYHPEFSEGMVRAMRKGLCSIRCGTCDVWREARLVQAWFVPCFSYSVLCHLQA